MSTQKNFSEQDIASNKGMAALSYLGILFLVPLLAAKESRYAQFHANQGMVFFIASIIVPVVGNILALIPFIGWIFSLAVWFLITAGFIMGLVNALQGQAKELPLIGHIQLI
ncbi:MAG: DUF4870 domain-containing protein [Niameybacter sp.]|uniref:DUF4870 domain-containing protein n=1 Tax=Niameybacter sp. TaxID=2033640 RepID=UPI002FC70425